MSMGGPNSSSLEQTTSWASLSLETSIRNIGQVRLRSIPRHPSSRLPPTRSLVGTWAEIRFLDSEHIRWAQDLPQHHSRTHLVPQELGRMHFTPTRGNPLEASASFLSLRFLRRQIVQLSMNFVFTWEFETPPNRSFRRRDERWQGGHSSQCSPLVGGGKTAAVAPRRSA